MADYWVVDVNARRLIVFREPRNGEYHVISAYEGHELVSPLVAPDAALILNDILPTEN